MPSAAQLDSAGQVGCDVGKDRFDVGEIKPAGDVLGGIVKDHGHVDRKSIEHLGQVIGAVLKVDGVGINWDRPRRVVKGNFATVLKIQKVLEQAGIHFTDDEAGEMGVRLQIGKNE
jgi:hypothetical protein